MNAPEHRHVRAQALAYRLAQICPDFSVLVNGAAYIELFETAETARELKTMADQQAQSSPVLEPHSPQAMLQATQGGVAAQLAAIARVALADLRAGNPEQLRVALDTLITGIASLLPMIPPPSSTDAKQEPIGHASPVPGTQGMSMVVFAADKVPVGSPLFLHRQPEPKRSSVFGIYVERSDGTSDFRKTGESFPPTALAYTARHLYDTAQIIEVAAAPKAPPPQQLVPAPMTMAFKFPEPAAQASVAHVS